MSKVLLAGGAGYIGSHTAVEMLNAGYEVVIVDNYYNSCPEAVKRVEEITGKKVALYEADVSDAEALRKVFAANDIDAVVHFAGMKAVGESVSKPVMYYENNLGTTTTLLKVMKEFGCSKFIFSSSATVYGDPDSLPLYETSPKKFCSNPYGWTKWMIEQILTDAAAADPELSVVLLRYFNPIGAHESGRIGEDPKGIPNNLLPFIAQVAVGRRDHLNLFGNDYPTPDGTCIRDYIHVVDLAKGHVCAVKYASDHKGTEIVNLGTGKGTSVLEMIEAFERVNGIKIPYEITGRRPGDIPASYANADKAFKLFGWKAEKTLDDMCRDTWNWQSKNPNGYNEGEKG
ncbi:MAG: UDP-glucose 4-epimerase GalE [Lachnospiraceae bacterium]|nr:UDP-glucose 4-epimerase GalE [Lachnospiraceae bacterium]